MPTIAELFRSAVESHQAGDVERAEALYREILGAERSHADACNNLGDIFLKQGKSAEAADCFAQALQLDPLNANAHYNLGNIFYSQGRLDEAAASYQRALHCNPSHPAMHINLGNTLKDQGQYEQAITSYHHALRLSPNHPDAHNNLGLAFMAQGEFDQAGNSFREALRLKPSHPMAQWNLSCLRLLQGDWAGAWDAHEHRWARPGVSPRSFRQPRWDGAALDGKTVLVHAEQGLGDTIQFARYVPLVQKRGARVVFECQRPLVELFHNFTGIHRVPADDPLPPFDAHIPLLSLPDVFGTTLSTVPADIPYLDADSALVERWQHVLGQTSPPKVARTRTVGIAWQGNPSFPGDCKRSIPLKYFEKLAQVPDIRLVSLQKELKGTDQLPTWSGQVPLLDLSDRLESFCDTAAVMKNLDLVVSSCTSVAHLAGALGVPVWTALQFVPDWRWLLNRSDTPWYPTMRLFRQKKPGAWDDVFERMAMALRR